MIEIAAAHAKPKWRKRAPKKPAPTRSINSERILRTAGRLRPKYLDLGLLAAVLGISAFGIAMVYSASYYNATVYFGDPFHYFTKQLIGFILGIVMLAATYMIDYRLYARFRWAFLAVGAVLLAAVFLPGIGIERLGARRWLGIGGFSMQPSEIAKFAFTVFAAATAAQSVNRMSFRKLLLILAAGGGFCALILLEPNLSVTLCVGMTMFILLFLYGAKLKHLGLVLLPVAVLIPIMLVAEPYRISRLVAFIDPWATPKAEGFQLIQSLFSLGNGGLFGRGFLNSTQKYMFLPFAESDFIFSIIGEEFGLIGCIAFLAALGFLVFRIFKVGANCPEMFGRFLCYGIGTLIFVQSAINLAVVTGSIPPTGIPLPFISFGGTSLAVYLAATGVVLNIAKHNKKTVKNLFTRNLQENKD